MANFQWDIFAAIMVACVVAALIVILWRRGTLSNTALASLSALITAQAEDHPDNGMISLLTKYCAIAVRAVEQLVASGQLERQSELKKETAMKLAEAYANVDGLDLTDDEKDALPTLVEEAVHVMNNAG